MASPGSVVITFKAIGDKAITEAKQFASSLTGVNAEAKSADTSLGKVESAVDGVASSARGAGTDLGKAESGIEQLGDAADTARTDLSTMDTELDGVDFDSLAVEAELAARRVRAAAADMGDGVHDGATDIDTETGNIKADMGETGKEAGAEFIGNIAEGIGSGQMNLNDVVSGTLGGITNLAATLTGPFGLAAAGAAAGVGLVFAAIKGQAEASKARVDTLIDALEEVGDTSSKAAKAAEWAAWLTKMKDNRGELGKIVESLKLAKIDQGTFKEAIQGSADAQKQVRDKLVLTGIELIKNQKAGETITEEQQAYLDDFPSILQQLSQQNSDLGETQDYYDDIDYLSGKTKTNAKGTKEELHDAKNEAHGLDNELDEAAKPRTLNFKVNVDKSKLPRHLGGTVDITTTDAGSVAVNVHTPTTTAATPAPAPPIVYVTEEQVYRAVQRLLLKGQARNGRLVMVG